MPKNRYKEFIFELDQEHKDECLTLILDLLEKGAMLQEIYESYLIPALANYECNEETEEICIWKEHTRTSIIRTILEATYPYIIKQKKNPIDKLILVACPQEEFHEIGAIIATNYFILTGFNAKYIGANTPTDEILSAVKIMKPDFLALSVTNYYNIVVTKKLTMSLRNNYPDLKIIIGGSAMNNAKTREQIQYDFLLSSYQDILEFREAQL